MGKKRRSSIALTSARAQSGAKRLCFGVSLCARARHATNGGSVCGGTHAAALALVVFRDVTSTGERHLPPSLIRISRASLRPPPAPFPPILVLFPFVFCSPSRAPPRWNGASGASVAAAAAARAFLPADTLCKLRTIAHRSGMCERLPGEKARARCR